MTADRAASLKTELEPLRGARWPIRCGHAFSASEMARLRQGLWPRDMDDRWAVWLDGSVLRCWRSWTNTCIYETQLSVSDDGTGVAIVLDVLDDKEAYQRASTDAAELERFEGVLSLVWRREFESGQLTDI
ncbi:hypothetical protein J2X02_000928 [Pseudoxanthomonas japonensis]|uniref:hypothetical protein n=1 Tax=Pseudoxanthomonas japonensis TaxID=69284 RepID=UPI00285BF765|nr:hypothetical protein [Pseudoxanthomonas japonensis]MDR7068111.1 hypothetical protein [Pseudoxanthomonas japonensis]